MSFSQGQEEAMIQSIFGDFIGKFLDAGAADGRCLSNTHALALRGWSGVCLEPSPAAFEALSKTYRDRPDIVCVAQPLGLDPHPITFHDSPDLVGTTVDAHRDKWKASGVPFHQSIQLLQITWRQIMERYGTHYDFINIDTEGTSADLFIRMPIEEMQPLAICVEHDDRAVELCEFAQRYGYQARYLDGNNLIVARR